MLHNNIMKVMSLLISDMNGAPSNPFTKMEVNIAIHQCVSFCGGSMHLPI